MTTPLERRRRVKATVNKISQLCADNPALEKRTQQFLSGELPMKGSQKPTAVRLSEPLLERLDSLALALNKDPQRSLSGPWNRSAVLREAVIQGVIVLERELTKTRKRVDESPP